MSEREEVMRVGLPVSDLGISAAFPSRKTSVQNARQAVADLADVSWAVCTVCDCPSTATPDESMCCGGAMRIQGWAHGGGVTDDRS